MNKLIGFTVASVSLAVVALWPRPAPIDVPTMLKLRPSFEEEFGGRTLDRTRWRTSYGPQGDGQATVARRSLYGNAEREIYVTPDYLGLGINPFTVANSALTIIARPLDQSARTAIGIQLASLPDDQRNGPLKHLGYSSGLITTQGRFAQQYGYFEMRARWTLGKGLWPAFWLLPVDGGWPPELDIMEAHGDKPTVVFQTKHSKVEATEPHRVAINGSPSDYHRYGMLWTPSTIRFYVDGYETVRTMPPADASQPMYLLANLAVGGTWPGQPDSSTGFPATMDIDWIRAWALPQGWQEGRLGSLDP